jgi:YHS domain-containing protein
MHHGNRRAMLGALAGALTALAAVPALAAQDPIYTGRFSNVAIGGTDPVAYFIEGRPVEGSRQFTHDWNGATWRFASAANRDRFAADPAAYAPQYGGYCAWAVAQGYTASTDPQAWRIVDGKLYLNYNLEVRERWLQDVPGHIAAADANWPKVLEK